jgi:hypothetical protein
MDSPTASPDAAPSGWPLIVRYRWLALAVTVLVFLAAFNGQWRVGRDSATFRQIARNLVRSHQYVFLPRGQTPRTARRVVKQDIVYPGMPVLLAGVERVFGEGEFAPQLVMYLLAAATIVAVYVALRMSFEPWIAIGATVLLALSRVFLAHANELLSDVPFLLGLMLSLIGYEKLRRASGGKSWAIAIVIAVVGLLLAAGMRPTFWILALAWIVACVWGLSFPENSPRGRRRPPYLVALGLLIALAALFILLDPRTGGRGVLAGGYEQRVQGQLRDLHKFISDAIDHQSKTLEEHIPTAFFAFAVKRSSLLIAKILIVIYSLMVILAGIALFTTSRLWGLLVAGAYVSLSALGDNPRYYLMILPLLLAGWCVFCGKVAIWLGPNRAKPIAGRLNLWHRFFAWAPQAEALPALSMLWGLGIVLVPNFVRDLDLVREQRGLDARFHYRGFVEAYEDGKMAPLVRAGEMIKRSAPKGARIMGPEPTILTYLSDHPVYDLDRMTGRWGRQWRQGLYALQVDLAIFPAGKASALYGTHDPIIVYLFDRRVFVCSKELDETEDGVKLCQFYARTVAGEHVKGSRTLHPRGSRGRHRHRRARRR